MALPALILWGSLVVDRLFGDPRNAFHPTAYLGRLIGWWGRPERYPVRLQRGAGVVFTLLSCTCYALPFFLFEQYAPLLIYLFLGPFLLKICFAWRCLEEHVDAVRGAAADAGAREAARMLVSRDTSRLEREHLLSAAYESMAENLVDSIIAPLFYFAIFGLAGAAFYRAANTADAMLGYRDERERIGWFPARLDDLLSFIPARVAGLVLLAYFAAVGRLEPAWRILRRDASSRPGINGGIPMATIAGGTGVAFEKTGVYKIGDGKRSLSEGGPAITAAVRAATLITAVLLSLTIYIIVPLGQ